jgi:FtsH-binding integral membrane protein
MATYDEFIGKQEDTAIHANVSKRSKFISNVLAIVAAGFAVTAVGTWFGMANLAFFAANTWFVWALFFVALGMIFTSSYWGVKNPMASIMYIVFTFIMGLSLAPLIAYAVGTAGTAIVFKALVGTVALFGISAGIGATTKKDLSSMGTFLLVALIGLIVGNIINYFIGSSFGEMILSSIGIILFTGFIAYDMQNIMHRYPVNAPILAAISLFLSIFNLFTSLLRLLLVFYND